MKLAISGQALANTHSLDRLLTLLNQLDCRWIELWPPNLEGGDPRLSAWHSRYESRDAAKAEAALNAHGIGVACITMPGAFFKEMASQAEDYLSALKKAVDMAVALHCKLVNSYCYHFALGREAPIASLIRVLRSAADYAAERGVTVVLENEAHDASGTVDGMLRILEAVNSPAMKTNYDPTNYYQASEEGYPYAYNRLKQYIAYVHLKGGCLYDPTLHLEAGKGGPMPGRVEEPHIYYPPLPEGAINVERLLTRLREDGYQGFCTIEPHVPAAHVERYYGIEVSYLRRHGVH
jgi:sugar phosphate isomerase/epimerase